MKNLLLSVLFASVAVPVWAQGTLTLEIKDGRVNLDATSVSAREILAEWARVGGTRIVGAEKITGAPLTLKLENMSEQQALDIILRNVAGYMAAPRRAAATPGVSAYDRIVILPTSSAPPPTNANANAAGRAGNSGPMAGLERRVPPRPPATIDADEAAPVEAVNESGDNNAYQQPPVFTFPQPQTPPPGNSVFVPVQQGGFGVPQPQNAFGAAQGGFGVAQPQPQGSVPQPFTVQPAPNGQPPVYNFVPPQGTPSPSNGGFNAIGTPMPGMVQQPVPAPGQPMPVPARPPGEN